MVRTNEFLEFTEEEAASWEQRHRHVPPPRTPDPRPPRVPGHEFLEFTEEEAAPRAHRYRQVPPPRTSDPTLGMVFRLLAILGLLFIGIAEFRRPTSTPVVTRKAYVPRVSRAPATSAPPARSAPVLSKTQIPVVYEIDKEYFPTEGHIGYFTKEMMIVDNQKVLIAREPKGTMIFFQPSKDTRIYKEPCWRFVSVYKGKQSYDGWACFTPVKKRMEVYVAPQVRYTTEIGYPAYAKTLNLEGTVNMRVTINHFGIPVRFRIDHKAGHGFDEYAIGVVGRWKFDPAYRNGKPEYSSINIRLDFRLDGSSFLTRGGGES